MLSDSLNVRPPRRGCPFAATCHMSPDFNFFPGLTSPSMSCVPDRTCVDAGKSVSHPQTREYLCRRECSLSVLSNNLACFKINSITS